MEQTTSANIYKIFAFLLEYPSDERFRALPELQTAMKDIEDTQVQHDMNHFLEILSNKTLDEWLDHYIEFFDFGKKTNLYVTYLKNGEQKERGLELLKLKKFYEESGYAMTDEELPDFLPLMLEFCSQVPLTTSNELLTMHSQAVNEIKKRLRENDSFYIYLFDGLIKQMENNGVTIAEPKEEKKQVENPGPIYPDRASLMNSINWNISSNAGGEA